MHCKFFLRYLGFTVHKELSEVCTMTSLTYWVHSSSKMIGFPYHMTKTIFTAQLRWETRYFDTGTLIVSRVQGAFIFLEQEQRFHISWSALARNNFPTTLQGEHMYSQILSRPFLIAIEGDRKNDFRFMWILSCKLWAFVRLPEVHVFATNQLWNHKKL